uniref:Putative receptor protein kinase ZmPK1 n=1 Tax=Tanacetum cinerariifolium TaxID=118510 RepID=A0A6L2LET4_TANCI|nr:putative receptor protein kinase ZmPK1 [Tanacetum cinerariifolium]
MFITSWVYLNDEYVAMTRSYFIQYTQHAILEFRDTLIQHLESVKKYIDERAQLKKEYDGWMNERQMQTTEEKVHTSKALDASSVDTESSRTESKEQDTSSRSGNDAHDDGADIRPIYDEEPMAKEAKKKTQERSRNSEPSLMPSARSQSTSNGSKLKPRSNTQTSRNWPASKSSFATTKTVPTAEHPRNFRNDSCVIKFLKEVNSRVKVPSNKTTNRNKPVEQISVPNKQEIHIPTGHRFSIKKTSVVQKKTITLRSYLRWKPTGRIFKTVSLRWIPTGKIFASSITKVDSEPLNGSNADITNQYECEQTLDGSACTLNLSACTSFNPKEEGLKVHDGACHNPLYKLKKVSHNVSKEIGRGASGIVYKGVLVDNEVSAIKRLKEFSNNQVEAKLIAVDISTLGRLNHMNLIKFRGKDLAASICGLSDCEKVDPSKVVVGKDDETLVLVFNEALGVGDGVLEIKFSGVLNEL